MRRISLPDGQVIMADRAKKEGLTRLDLTRFVRLETDGALTINPDLLGVGSPLVIVRLHPGFTGCSVTIVGGLVIPLPRHTSSNVCPRILTLSGGTTQPRANGLITREQPILRHSGNNTVPDAVIQVRTTLGFARVATVNPCGNLADINLAGCGLLRRIRSLRSNDLASNQCTTSGRRNG